MKRQILVLLLPLLLAATAFSASGAPVPERGSGPWNLTVFHTNDMHGGFLSQPATWLDDQAEVGGFVALSWWLEKQGRDRKSSLLLDAGDFMTGNPVCEIKVDGIQGAGMMDLMNALHYDAGVVGNHEFDTGRENLRALVGRADFPILAADILNEQGEPEFPAGPLILQRGDLKIGIIGVSCAGLFQMVPKRLVGGLSLLDQADLVRRQALELDEVCDLIILITHSGVNNDRRLARHLEASGVDLIVGGHSHTRLREPELEAGILIVQAGGHLKNLGQVDMFVEDDRIVRYDGRLVTLYAAEAEAEQELTDLVVHYSGLVDADFSRVIGRLDTAWERRGGESNIGNWLADNLCRQAGAEVAFLNSGGIRKNLDAGPISVLDIYEILPFTNELLTFEVTGAQLRDILKVNATAAARGSYGILQVSGVRFGYREVGDHVEVENVTVAGQPLQRDRVYRAAAPDYVLAMADRYLGMSEPAAENTGLLLREAIIQAVENTDGGIDASVDGRMFDLTGTK